MNIDKKVDSSTSLHTFAKELVDTLHNEVEELKTSLVQIEEASREKQISKVSIKALIGQFATYNQQSKIVLRTIRKIIKVENDVDKISECQSALEQIQNEQLVVAELASKSVKSIFQKASPPHQIAFKKNIEVLFQIRDKFHAVADICQKRHELFVAKQKLKPHEKTSIAQFDVWIRDKIEEDSPNKMFYTFLYETCEIVSFKKSHFLGALSGYFSRYDLGSLKITNQERQELLRMILGFTTEFERTKESKTDLVKAILSDFNQNRIEFKNEEEKKFYYKILVQQILGNPLEIPILDDDLGVSESERTDLKILKEFKPSSENAKISLQAKEESFRLLKEYYVSHPVGNTYLQDDLLISGAGPSGLLFALMHSLQGSKVNIIESRSFESGMRKNIIFLGKETPGISLQMFQAQNPKGVAGELFLLDFFGVTDRLVLQNKGVYLDPFFEASIGDVQKAMIESLCEISGMPENQCIQYHTTIQKITPIEDGRSSILLSDGKTITPKMVFVSEGSKSTTRALLGIDTVKLSKKSRAGSAFFVEKEDQAPESVFGSFLNKLDDVFVKLPHVFVTVGQFYLNNLIQMQKCIPTLEKLIRYFNRAVVYCETPKSEYLYSTLTKDEQKKVEKLEKNKNKTFNSANRLFSMIHDELNKRKSVIPSHLKETHKRLIALLDRALKDKKNQILVTDKEQRKAFFTDLEELFKFYAQVKQSPAVLDEWKKIKHQIKHFTREIQSIENTLQKVLEDVAMTDKDMWMQLSTLLEITPKYPKHVQRSFSRGQSPVVQIQRAEKGHLQIGETEFIITGDAQSTTDPLSGSGMKTSLLRASILYNAMRIQGNAFSRSVYSWGSDALSESMREEGLYWRSTYRAASERIERYLDIAVRIHYLSSEECRTLLLLEKKAQLIKKETPIRYSQAEINQVLQIQNKLQNTYATSFEEVNSRVEKLSKGARLAKHESACLLKFLTKALSHDVNDWEIKKSEFKQLRDVLSKIATFREPESVSLYPPESCFLFLFYKCQEIKPSVN